MLDQRQRDVLGLGAGGRGVFMGFVLYGGWDGGRAGHGLAVALGWTLGRARVLAPVALVAGRRRAAAAPGAARAAPAAHRRALPVRRGHARARRRHARPQLGPARRGTVARRWSSAHLQSHGGVVGEALYEVSHRLVQSVGVDILVVFLLLAGVILLTGASLAGVLRATGSGLLDTTRMVAALGGARARRAPRARAACRGRRRRLAAAPARARARRS